jgi:hypothetical protein
VASRRCYLFKQRCLYSPHGSIGCLESCCTIRLSCGSVRVCFFTIFDHTGDKSISGKLRTCVQKSLSFSTEEGACLNLCFDLSYFLHSLHKFHIGIFINAVNFFRKNRCKLKFLLAYTSCHEGKWEISQAGTILPLCLSLQE